MSDLSNSFRGSLDPAAILAQYGEELQQGVDESAPEREIAETGESLGGGEPHPDPENLGGDEADDSADEGHEGNETTPTPDPEPASPPTFALTPEQQAQWQFYQDLDRRIQQDREFAARFQQALNPTTVEPSTPVTPTPPVDIDPEVLAYLDQRLEQLNNVNEVVARHDALINQQQQQDVSATVNRVKERFAKDRGLDSTQIEQLYQEAEVYAPMIGSLRAQGVDPDTALTRVLDTAYWSSDTFRQHEFDRKQAETKVVETRKKKAGSLAGSSGSTPRVAEAPDLSNPNTKRAEMAKFLLNSVNGAE